MLRKSGVDVQRLPLPEKLSEQTELDVLRFVSHYPEIVAAASKEMKPNLVCSYLYELAQKYNAFYDQVSILQAEDEAVKLQRLSLCACTANVLAHGLALLGIKTVEEM